MKFVKISDSMYVNPSLVKSVYCSKDGDSETASVYVRTVGDNDRTDEIFVGRDYCEMAAKQRVEQIVKELEKGLNHATR